ncbi:hypothetical protein ZEAMMB73_Zm00001d007401 [Zea mays]|jgi:hypothetical protein|uniref:Uncharacterized protein n=1 Tax=Zea mays TaxID=4577 RepID=A0A1D6F625_MAIZE|nr:hypothetical protein ZEAMMB73_Zm00001d007401 [Zea mays]ONM26727.1 hypothetical protein ZEAMMB73_Zm00001d007401 [Zea mays]ONM26728.1 hypothetical protein ZEAMMB73_Zm00001d007401 [Zea mays]ONM26729.1 hypothetical protein ZEAMMB73_Zm00001d007401 [Zea mays]ONM26738.1 hypothetical protein ZEAMMB73_Zm00001d007401 [Zea mays]
MGGASWSPFMISAKRALLDLTIILCLLIWFFWEGAGVGGLSCLLLFTCASIIRSGFVVIPSTCKDASIFV